MTRKRTRAARAARTRMRRLYEQRLAAGVCVRCATHAPRVGRKTCETCAAIERGRIAGARAAKGAGSATWAGA